jgi:putative ABC transport system substrate-binding protein
MQRRDFVKLLGVAAAWPLAARAQQAGKISRVGVLWRAASAEQEAINVKSLVKGLGDKGYAEGRDIVLEHRFANDNAERFKSLAAELAASNVDVLIAAGTSAATSAKAATTTIPIVFALVADPAGSKLVETLQQPGGNATGSTSYGPDLFKNRLLLLKEIVPGLSRVGLLVNATAPPPRVYIDLAQAAAAELGMSSEIAEWNSINNLGPAFDTLKRANVQVFTAEPEGLAITHRALIAQIALARHLPLTVWSKEALRSGALMSYGPDTSAIWEQTADYVDKILKGAKPGELPVQQPTKSELVFNTKTAKALGLEIPQAVLTGANEVLN